jgi:ABC-2 type transport system permease protein
MKKFFSSVRKELILLIRDVPGLIILFVMPVLLMMVVTLAQENALRDKTSRTPVIFIDEAHSPLSEAIGNSLDSSGFFDVMRLHDGIPVTLHTARGLIREGNFQFGVYLAPGDSALSIMLDPTLTPAFRITIVNSLNYLIRGAQYRVAVGALLQSTAGSMAPLVDGMIRASVAGMPAITETYAQKDKATIKPNIIQNNVPGFILFAMFFIVIPLSGSLINERSEGSFQRLNTLPVHIGTILSGKVAVYFMVCLLQFMLMLLVGLYIFPRFFGLPALEMGSAYAAIAVATLAAALAAVGFGTLVGALARTHGQAALFGSVMVVLLGFISGSFLPIHVMPEAIRFISLFSPIRWGIDNYINLFIREAGLPDILPETLLLILFFSLAMIASIVIFARRK